MFSRLQYISQGATATEQLNNIQQALSAGCNWIQLRYKNATTDKNYTDSRRGYYDAIGIEGKNRVYNTPQEKDNSFKQEEITPIDNNTGYRIDPETGRYIGLRYGVNSNIPTTTTTLNSTNTPKDVVVPTEIIDPKNPLAIGNTPTPFVGKSQTTIYDTPLTEWQKINAALPLVEGAMTQIQLPRREHIQSLIPKLDMINSQPMENQVNQSYFNAARQNQLNTNPAMAIAGNQELASNRMDKLNEVIGNVLNQNTSLSNNEKEQTAATLNGDTRQNIGFDNKYNTQLDTSLLNYPDFQDMKRHQALTTFNGMIDKKLAFDSQLNSQKQYRTDEVINQDAVNKGATPIYRKRALYEPVNNGFGFSTIYTRPNVNFQDLPDSKLKGDHIEEQIASIKGELKNLTDPKLRELYSRQLTMLYSRLEKT